MWQNIVLIAGTYYLFRMKMAQMQLGNTLDSVEKAEQQQKQGATDALSNEITKQKKKKMGTQTEDSFDKSLPDRDKELIKAKQAQAKAAESEYNASQGPSEIEGVLLDVSWNR